MNLQFSKYQGAGNDFIMVNAMKETTELSEEQINNLCDRHFGIGADGLILLLPHAEFLFEMRYYNSDGKLGSMCGNGARATVAFASDESVFTKPEGIFMAYDGPHSFFIRKGESHQVTISMTKVDTVEEKEQGLFINTGSPHLIVWNDNVDNVNVTEVGRALRMDKAFAPGGTNVNFVEILDDNQLKVRTFERGVEDETLACGTGITAAAIALAHKQGFKGQSYIAVQAVGGDLLVRLNATDTGYESIHLSGPAQKVFSGEIAI